MTSISAGHIILTPTQPVGSGRPQRGSNPGPPDQESRALPTEEKGESVGKESRIERKYLQVLIKRMSQMKLNGLYRNRNSQSKRATRFLQRRVRAPPVSRVVNFRSISVQLRADSVGISRPPWEGRQFGRNR